MELTGSAVTALFVGLVWTLIKVVEFFLNKNKNKVVPTLNPEQSKSLSNIENCAEEMKNIITKQNILIKNMLDKSEDLYDMHNVYNDDHVPAWYVSPDLIKLVRENNIKFIDILKKMGEVGMDQDRIVEKMSDLIASQKVMTERLGDLITALNKNNR